MIAVTACTLNTRAMTSLRAPAPIAASLHPRTTVENYFYTKGS